jgi:hypothetical protein
MDSHGVRRRDGRRDKRRNRRRDKVHGYNCSTVAGTSDERV